MNSIFTTYKGTIEVLVTQLQQEILLANTEGKINISREDLEILFVLINSQVETAGMSGWEATKKAIEQAASDNSKTSRSRKK